MDEKERDLLDSSLQAVIAVARLRESYDRLKEDLLKLDLKMKARCPDQCASVLDHAIHSGRQEVLRELEKLTRK